jgi:hypothetical protein
MSTYYCDVLRRLPEDVWRLRPELWRQKNWLLQYNTPSHTSFFTSGFLTPKKLLFSPPNLFLFVYTISDKTERPTFWYNWSDGFRIAGGDEHPHGTRLPGSILKKANTLRKLHTRGSGLLRGWWWRVVPKLAFVQMAAPVPEIKDGSLY